ncbi:MAG: sigma-70 family RNA polymerase sigma factor [Bacteroidaceae bacterium]|nr:sigma-70 family RNA polymerase sigma factor [Bacteroidaceae bacterium]
MTAKEFSETFTPLGGQLYRIALHILESEQDAQDAVQDLYVRLWSGRDSLSDLRSPKAYCMTLIRNICIDRIRQKSNCRPASITENILQEGDTSSRVESKEKISAILAAVEKLPNRQREVLKMKVFDELSYEEIEEKTGMNYLTLRVLLSQARKQLKQTIR